MTEGCLGLEICDMSVIKSEESKFCLAFLFQTNPWCPHDFIYLETPSWEERTFDWLPFTMGLFWGTFITYSESSLGLVRVTTSEVPDILQKLLSAFLIVLEFPANFYLLTKEILSWENILFQGWIPESLKLATFIPNLTKLTER